MTKRKKSSQSSAAIEASLELARQQARERVQAVMKRNERDKPIRRILGHAETDIELGVYTIQEALEVSQYRIDHVLEESSNPEAHGE
jgi:hypothetical protein